MLKTYLKPEIIKVIKVFDVLLESGGSGGDPLIGDDEYTPWIL